MFQESDTRRFNRRGKKGITNWKGLSQDLDVGALTSSSLTSSVATATAITNINANFLWHDIHRTCGGGLHSPPLYVSLQIIWGLGFQIKTLLNLWVQYYFFASIFAMAKPTSSNDKPIRSRFIQPVQAPDTVTSPQLA